MPRLGVTEQTAFVRANVDAIAGAMLAEEPPPAAVGCRALVLLIGLPGSGKSHVARSLAAHLGAVVVASDALRRRLFVAPSYVRAESQTVFALAHAMARLLLAERHIVIFDATNLRERDRRPLYALASATAAGLVLVRVTAPEAVIRARLEGRLARISALDQSEADLRVYELMRERYEEPSRPALTIDRVGDLEREIERVAEAVRASCA